MKKWAIPVLASILILGLTSVPAYANITEFTDNFVHVKWFSPFEPGVFLPPDEFARDMASGFPFNEPPGPTLRCDPLDSALCTINIPNFIDQLDTKIIEIKVEYPLTVVPTEVVPVVTCFDPTLPGGEGAGNLLYTGTANLIANFVIYDFECLPNPDSETIVITLPPTVVSIEIWTKSFGDIAVGGTFVPIDQSALLLAGVQSVSMWMIPVVLSAAGIGVGIYLVKRRF